MPLVPSSFPSWFRWTAAPWVWSAAAVPTTSGLRPRSGRFVWSAAASRFRPAATSPAARPFEAEEVWQAPSPEQLPAPQSQDSLFQEDEPSTPLTRYYEDDYETERDLERMKNLYPEISKELFPWIEDVCDQMEYEGSLMYDESPDQNQVRRLTSRIYGQVKEQYQPPEGEDKDEMLAMNQETWRRYPPDQNWLSDLIQTLLVDEMFRRRCRRRNTRWWS